MFISIQELKLQRKEEIAAAGASVRKAMQDLKVLAQEIRAEVTEKKNSAK